MIRDCIILINYIEGFFLYQHSSYVVTITVGKTGRQTHKEIAATIKDHRETMCADQELRKLGDFKLGTDHIQVICGCTGKDFGDITGTLKVDFTGKFEIIHCTCPTCSTSGK